MLAAATLGLALNWDGTRSTGGVVALVASIVMGLACRSWEAWRKWIWLPVAITVLIAFVMVNFYVSDATGEPGRADGFPNASTVESSPREEAAATAEPSAAQLRCESHGWEWIVAHGCQTPIRRELRTGDWGSIGDDNGRLYYSFGDNVYQCGDRLCQMLYFRTDEFETCPQGIYIVPSSNSQGVEGTSVRALASSDSAEVQLVVPDGKSDIVFAYDWYCP